MAKLVYDDTGRLLFTKEMKQEYTLLMPQMLPVHFGMMKKMLECEGYKVDMLTTDHRGIVDEGLKYVHNDTCYPALLVIGQLLDAVKNGADYLGVGAMFSTSTKSDADVLSMETLREICAVVDVPVVAIGGISAGNILQLCGSGVDGVAVVSAIFAADDPGKATADLLKLAKEMVASNG